MQKKREYLLLAVILLFTLTLSLAGIQMGTPFRWYVDEVYTVSIRILSERSLVPTLTHSFHPGAHTIALALFQIPYFLFLKLSGCPLESVAASAHQSWTQMAFDYPQVASGIILWSRFFSVILGLASGYIVYRLGKKMFNPETGLCAALALAVCMDFSGMNHFATPSSLVAFLVLFSFYHLFRFYRSRFKSRAALDLSAFAAGLCFATKINGIIAFLPLVLALFFADSKRKNFGRILIFSLLGVVIGNPIILIYPQKYFEHYFFLFFGYLIDTQTGLARQLHLGFMERTVGLVNYLLQFIYGMGIPLTLFTLWGGFLYFFRQTRFFEKLILSSLILTYWAIIGLTQFGLRTNAPPKASVVMMPFLALLAGVGIYSFLTAAKIRWLKRITVVLAIVYSIGYCLAADWILIKGDTRYKVTQWVKENIPPSSTIEFLFQINRGASEELLRDYQILYGGLNSAHLGGTSPFKDMDQEPSDYYASILQEGPKGEYVLLSFDFFSAVDFMGSKPDPDSARMTVVYGLLNDKYPYRLVKKFIPPNNKKESKKFRRIYVPISFWKNPIPNMGYTSPIVYIYQRT